jgi:hypothetical protein
MSEIESSHQKSVATTSLREMVTDAIRYWEPRRLIYNAILALIVIGYFFGSLPESRAALSFDGFLFVFILAVLANLCYCAAYIVDIFAQFSGFRVLWLRWRWLLLALGVTFAGIITRFFALGFFSSYHA